MMNRIKFFDSISGIDYPEMLVKYYDHFLALKDLVSEYGIIQVISSSDDSITFSVTTSNPNQILSIIAAYTGQVNVYNKLITVNVDNLTDSEILITLK